MESGPAECQIEGGVGGVEGGYGGCGGGAGEGGVTREGDEGMRRGVVGSVDTAG